MEKEKKKKLTKKQKRDKIYEDLKNQLFSLGKYDSYYEDMLNDYMSLYDVKEELKKDVKKNKVRTKEKNGNGFEVYKDNSSVERILRVNNQMTKILTDLGIIETKSASPPPKKGDIDDLLSRD